MSHSPFLFSPPSNNLMVASAYNLYAITLMHRFMNSMGFILPPPHHEFFGLEKAKGKVVATVGAGVPDVGVVAAGWDVVV